MQVTFFSCLSFYLLPCIWFLDHLFLFYFSLDLIWFYLILICNSIFRSSFSLRFKAAIFGFKSFYLINLILFLITYSPQRFFDYLTKVLYFLLLIFLLNFLDLNHKFNFLKFLNLIHKYDLLNFSNQKLSYIDHI